jgi:predicted Zn-dependent peptidase
VVSIKNLTYFLFLVLSCCIDNIKANAQEDIFAASVEIIDRLKSKVQVSKLHNGITVVTYPRGIAPVFSAVVAVGVGGVDETSGETGISHMLEHMAFKGSKLLGAPDNNLVEEENLLNELEAISKQDPTLQKLDTDQLLRIEKINQRLSQITPTDGFTREYERRGAVNLNAATNKDQTLYYVNLPKSSFEYWALAESEKIIAPVMRQFYKERDVVLEERRTRFEDDPNGKLFEKLLQVAYPNHPYGLPLIGFEQDIRSLTASKLLQFHKRFYVPSNIVISIVGDIDLESDMPIINKYFGRIPISEINRNDIEQPQIPKTESSVTILEKSKPMAMVAYFKPNYPHPDDAVLSVASEVFNGSSLSPLYDTLVKKERIAVSISDEEAPGARYPNLLVFSIVPKTGVTNKQLLKRFDEVLTEAINKPDQQLIDHAKRAIAKSYTTSVKSSESLAALLAEVQLKYGDWSALTDWYHQAMEVTKNDITEVSNKYLIPSNRVVGYLEQE